MASREDNTGAKRLFAQAFVYQAFQNAIGAKKLYGRLAREYLKLSPGARLLDIGCGPAAILGELPEGVDYVGLDGSARYVGAARARWGKRGEFRCVRVEELTPGSLPQADRVLALGVLHHLDDTDAASLFRLARSALAPGGRVISYDPCFTQGQGKISRFLVSRDRGRYVRAPEGYAALARAVFPDVTLTVLEKHLRIPYTAVVLEMSA